MLGRPTEQDNPHTSTYDSLQQALNLLSSGGSLTEACLLLESTLQSGTCAAQASQIPGFDGGEAAVWVLLGQTQAMDEKEVAAVRALEEGRRRFEVAGAGTGETGRKVMGEGLVVSWWWTASDLSQVRGSTSIILTHWDLTGSHWLSLTPTNPTTTPPS